MKKLITLLLILGFSTSLALAQTATAKIEPKAQQLIIIKGDIIDNACANSQKPKDLANFVKSHTKQCALMPACVASGYSIYSDGKLYKFDNNSNVKILEFLKQPKSKLQVMAKVTKAGSLLSLLSIQNQ